MDLWYNTVVVSYAPGKGWHARIDWFDTKICQPICIQGHIETRYSELHLDEAIDRVTSLAERFGIKPHETMSVTLLYEGDGEDPEYPTPPDYRQALRSE